MKPIYLNNAASTFPKPSSVTQAVEAFLQQPPLYSSRNSSALASYKDLKTKCRQSLAELFNAPHPSQIVFTSGATESLNLALKGLNLQGKHVVTSSLEHNSVLRILKTMEQEDKIALSIVPCAADGSLPPSALLNQVQPHTTAVVLSHCSNVTGALVDIATIGQSLASKDITFIVDASQSAGLYPIDVQAFGIDILCFTGHKALWGLAGIGGLYIHKKIKLTPLKLGGTGSQSNLLYQPQTEPSCYEAGTANFVGILSLYEGVQYIQKVGLATIQQKVQATVASLKKALEQQPNIQLYSPSNQASTILSFTIQGVDNEDVGYLLAQNFGIWVRTGLHCAPLIHPLLGAGSQGTIRVSPSYFTTTTEIEAFLEAIQDILIIAE